MTNGYTHCYVVQKSCGCYVAACVDTTGKMTADFFKHDVAPLVERGAIVERMTIEEMRAKVMLVAKCPHEQKQMELFE